MPMCKPNMDWPIWEGHARLAGSVAALAWRDKQVLVDWGLRGALAEFLHVAPVCVGLTAGCCQGLAVSARQQPGPLLPPWCVPQIMSNRRPN